MRDDLLDAEAAINWAIAQQAILAERVIKWKRDRPYTIRIDTDSEPGQKLYRLTEVKPLDPLINAEAGAIIHNLRSSLDLLACTLAARNGFRESKSTHFPIWKSEADFLSPKSRAIEKIKRLSQIDQDIIKDLRPYPGGNDLLCALHDLDLTRKHRRLLDLFVRPRGMRFEPSIAGPLTIRDWQGGLNEEAVLVTTSAIEPDGDITIGLYITVDETSAPYGKDFAGTIRDFARLAMEIIRLFD